MRRDGSGLHPQVLRHPVGRPRHHRAWFLDAESQERLVNDTLRMLELFPALNEGHRMHLLVLAETFAEWAGRYDYGE